MKTTRNFFQAALLGALLQAVTVAAHAAGFTTTSSLATAREVHTATLLPNGKVLVTGGYNSGSGALAGAEVYDPATGTWTATGSLATARELHTATLLPNGKVLVTGGYGSSGYLASAELYDPATGTWTATGSLATARYVHMATLLPNGKVLVTGGYGISSFLASAEVYDPATGTWTATGSLATARYGHTATLLPNGKVLVTGGDGSSSILASAELYDPATGTWTATGFLATARDVHTATLLPNGKVLVTGGYNNSSGSLASAEVYDYAAGTFATTGSLATAREVHTATLLPNGQVLVTGGSGGSGYLAGAEVYDPATGTWTATGSLATARCVHTATLLPNGKVLVTGGLGSSSILASAEVYDPATGTWTGTGALATARELHTATLLPNGKVLVTGGYNFSSGFLASAEVYDPATGTWTATGSLATARYDHTATLLPNGKVLVTGGYCNSGYLASAEVYDPATGMWTATGSLATARYDHTATLLPNGKVLVTGGYGNSGALASAEVYDPATGTWPATGSLATARYFHTATLLPNGKMLVTGGGGSSADLASAELYDVGLGFNSAWQPQISTATSPLGYGNSLSLTGAGFRGVAEGSGGNTQDSSADYPVVQLRRLDNEQTIFLNSTNWGTNAYTSTAVTNQQTGWALVTVFVNGIPSPASLVSFGTPPQILTQPTNQMVAAGSTAAFTATASGVATLGYQWYFSSAPVAGGTNSTLTVSNAAVATAGNYQLVVTNSFGSVTSSVATLWVDGVASVSGFGGTGTGWTLNSVQGSLPTISGDVLAITSVAGGQRTAFFNTPQMVTNGFWAHFTWTMTVNAGPADGFTFTVQAQGTNAISSNLSGNFTLGYGADPGYSPGISRSLAIGIENDYNDIGTDILEVGTNGVLGLVTDGFSPGPFSYAVLGGMNFETPNAPVQFFISYNPGNNLMTVKMVQGQNTFQQVIALPQSLAALIQSSTAYIGFTGGTGGAPENGYAEAQSIGNFVFGPGADPGIATPLTSQTALVGSNVSIPVSTTGTAPFSYQWFKGGQALTNGGNVSGATGATLNLGNVQVADSANYFVVATNHFGSVTSTVAPLTVYLVPPFFIATTNSGFGLVNGQFQFTLNGPAGSNAVISASTNLQTWIPLVTNPLTLGSLIFTDAQATNYPHRYYRATLGP